MASGKTLEQEGRYAPKAWAKSRVESFEYETPSGQLCLLRSLRVEDILRLGLVNELDYFSQVLVDPDEKDKSKTKKQQASDSADRYLNAFSNVEQVDKMLKTVNAVVAYAVIEPKLEPVPEDGKSRLEDTWYVDDVDFMDRIGIFTEVFEGLGDMEKFRGKQADGVGDVEEEQSLSDEAE